MMSDEQPHGLTRSEQFVARLSGRAFLKLWTHPNPKGKKGKELCDCLVVCGPHVIIISVKENQYKETGDSTGWERWTKEAIDKSASQIWGAERWLSTANEVTRYDGRTLTLPPKSERQYHRISVSLGGRGQVPLKWGDLGNGFVHVCDERSVDVVFGVLDTITDFVEFLAASEAFIKGETYPLFAGGGIEDLVALYLSHGRTFNIVPDSEKQPDLLILDSDLWTSFSTSNEFRAMKNDLSRSYEWDRLIEFYAADLLTDRMFDMYSKQVTKNELALVAMALQPRRFRASLAEALFEFLADSETQLASRVVLGFGQTAFVFLVGPSSDRELRSRELKLRCYVIRGRVHDVITVVGIATDRPGTSEIGYASDIAYIHLSKWTSENEADVIGIQNDLGYFKNLNWKTN